MGDGSDLRWEMGERARWRAISDGRWRARAAHVAVPLDGRA